MDTETAVVLSAGTAVEITVKGGIMGKFRVELELDAENESDVVDKLSVYFSEKFNEEKYTEAPYYITISQIK